MALVLDCAATELALMEYVGGGIMIIIGLLMALFGGARTGKDQEQPDSQAMPAWLDNTLKWGMALICFWFGTLLLLGRVGF
jgi:hypothetical protein